MLTSDGPTTEFSSLVIKSVCLKRTIRIDCYLKGLPNVASAELMLINDGQDLLTMDFTSLLDQFEAFPSTHSFIFAGIHCSEDRKNEYGTAGMLDYAGRGTTASAYQQALTQEIIPAIRAQFKNYAINHCGIAGFSLGGLSAIDTLWNNPGIFSYCGVFSGSLWWRDKDQDDVNFDESTNRIIHKKVKEASYHPGLRFFFEAGRLDETADRNKNGIIDAIDDTLDLIEILKSKGYQSPQMLHYLEMEEGRHDIETWKAAFPSFLEWLYKPFN